MDTPGMDARYDADYFLRGKQTGKSLYSDYRWLPNLTVPMVEAITDHLGAEMGASFLDFGCARGYIVKALNILGFDAVGYDISDWALSNCDEAVKGLVSSKMPARKRDWVIAKDTLEHVPMYNLNAVLSSIFDAAEKGVFIVVPLAYGVGQPYVVEDYEKDVTHVIRWPIGTWVEQCHAVFDEGWEVSARYRLQGVKDNYADWPKGNAFITCRRIG